LDVQDKGLENVDGRAKGKGVVEHRQDPEGFIVLIRIGYLHVYQICLRHSIGDIGQSCFCMNELVSEFRDILIRLTYCTFQLKI
jgi:hypothetical protein